jgi:hypothetical protein
MEHRHNHGGRRLMQTPDGRTLTVWRRIPEFPKYQITPDGDVRNIRTGRLLAETENKTTGAYYYTLGKLTPDGRYISTTRNYRTLVASAYPEQE